MSPFLNPSAFKQVYLGALGEVVGKYILEEQLGWDLKDLDDVFAPGTVDAITVNPPYKAKDSGIINEENSLEEAVNKLIERANYYGGKDNIGIVLVGN